MHAYIGVRGFGCPEDVCAVLYAMPERPVRKLMVGVIATQKTIAGEKDCLPKRCPQAEHIARIFHDDRRALNVIHYAGKREFDIENTILRLADLGGPLLHGLRFEIPWPEPAALEEYATRHPKHRLSLVVNLMGRDGAGLVEDAIERLKSYDGVLTDILVEHPFTMGVPAAFEGARGCLEAIQDADLGLGVGMSCIPDPAWVATLAPLVREFPGISFDAEPVSASGMDKLDLNLARDFVVETHDLFRRLL